MDIHKNLNQTTELDSARNDLSVEKKLLDCIENLVMNDDFTAAVNSGLTTILEYYDADRTYIFEFQWKENLTRNTYEICRDGISPQIENLQTVPVDVVARWVDSFEDQEQNTISLSEMLMHSRMILPTALSMIACIRRGSRVLLPFPFL